MSVFWILFTLLSAITILLILVMRFRLSAFIALLLVSIYAGIMAGMPLNELVTSIQEGMGSTLGFVALVVGLGAIFGQLLELSGGARSLALYLVRQLGEKNASWAMMVTGFIIAIPVFFDVGLIILVPILYALSRNTGRSLLYFGIPLLAGLAVTHSFIPPTPGPVAVAEIINVPLGWVIIFGFMIGPPVAILAGPVFGKYISSKIRIAPPEHEAMKSADEQNTQISDISFRLIVLLIGFPLLLIVLNTSLTTLIKSGRLEEALIWNILIFIGHPIVALIIANLLAYYFLGIRRGFAKEVLLKLSTKSLGPAGIIILITGAGGVLKQVLVNSGMGSVVAQTVIDLNLSPIFLGWLLAGLIRVIQGSATVAMITAAGLIAPALDILGTGDIHRALIVLAIASGATILSHVNDSGFWLVGQYFGLSEKQTLQSWTIMETLIALGGLLFCLVAGRLVNLF